MRIPPHKIEEIRQAVDIVDVVSGSLTLRRRGKNFFGLCPFHQEKTPSFSVNPQMQIFRCFGCGAGGNVFHFVMRMEGLSFPDAVRWLAERAGIPLELEEEDREETRLRENLFRANQLAADFYREQLFAPAGKRALSYLRGRGFSDETIEAFGLGYAPDSWDAVLILGQKQGLTPELLEQAGLVIRREGGGYYDRFRDRVVFPLYNLSGRVIGFGARRLQEDDESPKYINSPETPIYKKGTNLYGLYQAREAVREQDLAVVVEGYTDLISLYQNGLRNVVATLGTALTPEQARLIRRYTRNVVLFYDSDSPGFKAALRGAEIMVSEDIDVKIAAVPTGEDPDSYVRKRGAEAVRSHLDESASLFEFRLRRELESVQPSDPSGRAAVASSVLESVSYVKNRLKRSVWVSWLADQLDLDERALTAELNRLLSLRRRPQGVPATAPSARSRPKSRRSEAERMLVGVLLHSESLGERVVEGLRLVELTDPAVREILRAYEVLGQPGEVEITRLLSLLEAPEAAELVTSLAGEPPDRFDSDELAFDCFRTICTERIEELIADLQDRVRREPASGAEATRQILELLRLKDRLQRGEENPFEHLHHLFVAISATDAE